MTRLNYSSGVVTDFNISRKFENCGVMVPANCLEWKSMKFDWQWDTLPDLPQVLVRLLPFTENVVILIKK